MSKDQIDYIKDLGFILFILFMSILMHLSASTNGENNEEIHVVTDKGYIYELKQGCLYEGEEKYICNKKQESIEISLPAGNYNFYE